MNLFAENRNQLLSLLQAGDIFAANDVLRALKQQKLQSAFEISEVLFLEAKIYLYEGSYLKALNPLQASLIHDPTRLSALCDLALCHYQLGLHSALQENLEAAYELLTSELHTLQVQAALDAAIFVAKLFEELGRIDEALQLLEQISKLALSAKQQQAIYIQKLRLATEIGDISFVKSLYGVITSGTQHTHNFEIEREHSLLLADCLLFGLPQAMERFGYLNELYLVAPDKAFLQSEIAEHIVLQGAHHHLATLKLAENSEAEYEKHQARLIKSFLAKEKNSPLSVIRLEKTLSLVSLLRLLRQSLVLFPLSDDIETVKARYRFHCSLIPSKKLQIQLSQFLKDTNVHTMIINTTRKSLVIGNKEVPVKAALFWQLIPLFNDQKTEASLDEVIQAIYQEEPNLQHFDRLRMGVSRLNAALKTSTDIDGIFKVSKTTVTLLVPAKEHAS